ncbi:MAG TPA: HypC/HybG/HupF family hydrogenase formation chaperone [Solirubrobacteraceae bacterium]|nr:HypC/HybG/HupF family hydrogenase formation chaperone [Solirubrobacteraceae bacterium]
MSDACDAHERCITCSDEGIPMRVRWLDGDLALCEDAAGATHEVAVELIAPVRAGDPVLVHACVAVARLEVERVDEDAGLDAPAARR